MMMINYRYLSLFSSLVLSGLWLSPISLAAKVKEDRDRTIFNQAFNQTIILAQTKNSPAAKPPSPIVPENNATSKAGISKRLSLIGMAATSLLSLIILVMLFKKEKLPELEVVETVMPRENSHAPSTELLQAHEIVELLDIPIIGMQYDEQPEPDAKLSQKLLEAQPLERIALDAATIIDESLETTNSKFEPMVDSDIMGKLTIVTSTTTEIDIVFELIQDLQHNSYLNGDKHTDLRRKAIWELGQTNDFRAVEPLIKMISQVNALEKNLILDAITQIAHQSFETINHVLLTCLEDESVEVRKNSIQDLTRLYQSMSLITVHLTKMTQDSDREVQQTAEWALQQFKQMSAPLVPLRMSGKYEV
jgi:hypothetical protein